MFPAVYDGGMGDGAVASIAWLSREEGGRRALPTKPTYLCVARFDDDRSPKSEAWDVEIRFIDPPDRTGRRAAITFRSKGAPTHYLRRGNRFALIEGPNVVARGEIVENPATAGIVAERPFQA